MHVEVKRIPCKSWVSLSKIHMEFGDQTHVTPGLAASAFNSLNHLTDS